MRGKPTRLKASLLSGSDELVRICLPYWFRDTLISLTERMLWTRVWTDDELREHALTESEKTRIEYGIYLLMQDDCGQDMEQIEDILNRLEELEQMNVYVNCGGGCGCGCGDKTQDAPPPDYESTPPVTGGIPEVINEGALAHKCNMAHYLMYVLRLAAIQSANFTGGYQSWADYWGDIFTFVDDPNLTKFQYQPYITIKAALAGIHNTDVIVIPFDPIYNELVCAIYSAPNSQVAADNVEALLRSAYTDYFVRSMMLEINSQLPYDIAFDVASVSSNPPGFSNRDCTHCSGGSAELPTPPSGYVLIPLIASDIHSFTPSGGNNTHSFDESQTQFSYAATVGEWNASLVKIDTAAIKARAGVEHLFGAVLQVTSTNADDGDYDNISDLIDDNPGTYNYHLPEKQGVMLARYKADHYLANEVYKDWIDQFDEISAYGSAPVNIDNDLAAWTVGTRFAKTVVYKVWFIGIY